MPGEAGPVGGKIAVNPAANATVIEMTDPHGLADGEQVRISTNSGYSAFYVKAAGQPSNTFSLFSDPALKTQATVQGAVAGDQVDRLNSEDWAIVAGINDYPSFTCLKGAVYDSSKFRDWTLRRGFVPENQVLTIQSPPTSVTPPAPTLEHLREAFSSLVRRAAVSPNHRLGRRLYIFLSGHGIVATLAATPDFREAALLMANADATSLGLHIGARAHAEWFRTMNVFDEVILFADCCRDQEDNVAPTNPILPKWRPQGPPGRYFYGFPTMLGSKAWERPFGDAVRGIFGYAVVEALNNPKLYFKNNGSLPGLELESHLYATVPDLTDKQSPVIDYPHDPKQAIMLARWFESARQKVKIVFSPPCPAGQTAQIFRGNNRNLPLMTLPADQNWMDDLDVGWLYKVFIPGTDRKQFFETTGSDEVQLVTL